MLSVGRVDEAKADIDQALRIDPNFSDALALQSIIAVVQNEKEKALNQAQKAVAADPQSATAQIALSYARQARFDLEGARTSVEAAVKLDPENAIAWARLADLQASFGELGKALEAAKKAESLAPDLALTQTVLGFALLTQVNIDESMAVFEKAITLDQAAPLPRLGLGLAKIRKGDLEEGGREIEIAAGLDSSNSLVRSYLGKTYYEEKRIPLDEREYQIAKELDPNDPTPWFYDAIAKQTTNRPVEALHNIQKAIELNDNRLVYRSKLLLDSDLAARQSSLARIYKDLGFQQRALVEGWQSVNTDPTNFSAHRFLSDSYAALPRREIARVSELLQSQLLQPINITPIQPRLTESNLFLISSQGPSTAGFNTYNPLFNRNQAVMQAGGLAGSNSTWGAEGVVSGIYDKLSLSAGYTHFKTDGWRTNADQKDDIANVFAQLELTYKTSIQAEYRYRDNDRGDIELRSFEDDFLPNLRKKDETNTVRLGFRHGFSPSSVLIGNFQYSDADRRVEDSKEPVLKLFEIKGDDEAYGGELQYLFRSQYINIVGGAGHFEIDSKDKITREFAPPGPTIKTTVDRDTTASNAYLYSYIKLLENLTLTLGGSGDFVDTDDDLLKDKDQFNPKFGLTWNPLQDTTLRAAAFRVLKRTLITDQTLEPTQVAGFNQFFDEINVTDYWLYGGAIDQKFSENIYGGAEYTYRDLNVPFTTTDQTPELVNVDWEEKLFRAYLFWTPRNWLALSAEYRYEDLDRDKDYNRNVKSAKTNYVPLGVNFFHPSGLSASFKGTYIDQDGRFNRQDARPGVNINGQDNFWLFDAAISYRFPKRYGFLTVGVRNLTDEDFEYFDTDPDNPRVQPDRFFFVSVTLALP